MSARVTLPPYVIRRSTRAKYARISVRARNGIPTLEVVLPYGFNEAEVPEMLEKHAAWIMLKWEKQLEIEKTRMELPLCIDLPAIGEAWPLVRNAPDVELNSLDWDEGLLKVNGMTENKLVIILLKKWLILKAKFHLVPLMWSLAEKHDFSELQAVAVRCQKTLWGSCTGAGRISLNCKLLFLPSYLVNHVLLHELCHLREMNHSKAFHNLLQKFDPDERTNGSLLRSQEILVPGWFGAA